MDKEAQRKRDKRKNLVKKVKKHLITAVILIVAVVFVAILYSQTKPIDISHLPELTLTDISEVDHSKGNPTAEMIIFEYSDFQCPYCAQMSPVVSEVVSERNDTALVFRHFPLSFHDQARLAAQASEAAANQGKFWEYHDILYAQQSDWSNNPRARTIFIDYASQLGLDVQQFEIDMDSDVAKAAVQHNFVDANLKRVDATPTFFLNGVPLRVTSKEQLHDVLDRYGQ